MHAFQTFEPYVPDLDAGAGGDVKRQVQDVPVRILLGYRRIDPGECVALILERRQQSRTARQHVSGNRGCSRREPEAVARGIRHRAFDPDGSEMVEGTEGKGNVARGFSTLRQRRQRIAKSRLIESEAIDGDGYRALVVTETLQNRGETRNVGPGTSDQPKGPNRG